jgi:hypothetical protein
LALSLLLFLKKSNIEIGKIFKGDTLTTLETVTKHGMKAQGKREYIECLETGKKLLPMKAIKAQCYQCTNAYMDTKIDCEIKECPLYPYMPYRKDKEIVKRERTEKQVEAGLRLAKFRSGTHKTMRQEMKVGVTMFYIRGNM